MRSTSIVSPGARLPPRRASSSLAARAASRTAPAAIQVIREADAEPAEPTELVVACGQSHAGRGRVIEPLGVADVLETDGEANPAPDALAARRVARAARKAQGVARQLLRLGYWQGSGAADHLRGRERAGDPLAGRERVAGCERVPETELDGVDAELGGQLVHLRLVREAALHGAETAHCAARRIVRVDAGALDERVLDRIRAAGKGRRVRGHGCGARGIGAPVEQDPRADVDELAVAVRPVLP